MFYHPTMDEDLVRLRRSLAMAPSLPADEADKLLNEVERLRSLRRGMAVDLDELAKQIRRLRAQVDDG